MRKLLLSFCLLSFQLLAQTNDLSKYNVSTTGFLENKGQIVDQNYRPNPAVKYLLTTPGFNIQLRQTGFSYDTYTEEVKKTNDTIKFNPVQNKFKIPPNFIRHYHRVDIELLGCNTAAHLMAEGTSSTYFNYFTAGTQQGGVSEVHYFKKITYKNIYPNIDLIFSVPEESSKLNIPVEYNFIVHPGGNPSDIKLEYKGANKVSLAANKIVVNMSAGDFSENIPSSYLAKTKQPVQVNYSVLGNTVFGFQVRDFQINNLSGDLIIDPAPNLAWGTYYGGSGTDQANAIAVDYSHNVYITGITNSSTNIATAGAYKTVYGGILGNDETFVAKFNSSGSSLLWGTYYGVQGLSDTYAYSIALDNSDNVYITGSTTAQTTIATAGAYQTVYGGGSCDAFIAKFNPTGTTLLWGTYYGGIGNDFGYGIALDASDNVYIVGNTTSNSTIATASAYKTVYSGGGDAFVAKFNSSGTALLWGTYFGGSGADAGYGIALDASDNCYIIGTTNSTSSIATAGAYQITFGGGSYDAFVTEFNSTGTLLLWGTYYGGLGYDEGYSIALGANDTVYIDGGTESTNGISSPGALETAFSGTQVVFAAKLAPNGSSRFWGTYFDIGDQENDGSYIALDACDNVYLGGDTFVSGLFPSGIATPGAYETTNALSPITEVGFVAKINTTGNALIWGTYYGGAGNGEEDIGGMALDDSDNIYITGSVFSSTNVATIGAYQTNYNGNTDAFIAKFDNNPICGFTAFATQTNVTCFGQCTGQATVITISGTTPYTYNWLPTGGTSATATGLCAGTYSCTIQDAYNKTTAVIVNINQPPQLRDSISTQTNNICYGGNIGSLTVGGKGGTGSYTYNWTPSGDTDATAGNLTAGSYTITVSDANGCTATANATISQPAQLRATNFITNETCFDDSNGSVIVSIMGGINPYSYMWSPTNNTNLNVNNVKAGIYTCTITDNNGCVLNDTVIIKQPSLLNSFDSTLSKISCYNQNNGRVTTITNGGTMPYTFFWSDGQTTQAASGLSVGSYTVTILDSNGCKAKDSVTLSQPTAITLSTSSKITPCPYDSGSVMAIASGGTGTYTYNWTPGGGITASVKGLKAGTYYVNVTDSNGCSNVDSAIVKSFAVNFDSVCCNATINYGQSIGLNVLPGDEGETYVWYPSNGLSCTTCPNPIASPNNPTDYQVTITDSLGCVITEYVSIDVNQSCNIFVPDAFSPNGDGQNDILYVKGPCIQSMDFIIYDRWGNKVFESENVNNGWDGTYKGKPMNTGSFVYYFKALLLDGTTKSQKGTITLVR